MTIYYWVYWRHSAYRFAFCRYRSALFAELNATALFTSNSTAILSCGDVNMYCNYIIIYMYLVLHVYWMIQIKACGRNYKSYGQHFRPHPGQFAVVASRNVEKNLQSCFPEVWEAADSLCLARGIYRFCSVRRSLSGLRGCWLMKTKRCSPLSHL